jgi:hypothetical protein
MTGFLRHYGKTHNIDYANWAAGRHKDTSTMRKPWLDVITEAAVAQQEFVAAERALFDANKVLQSAKHIAEKARSRLATAMFEVTCAAQDQVSQISGIDFKMDQAATNMTYTPGQLTVQEEDWAQRITDAAQQSIANGQISRGSPSALSLECLTYQNHPLSIERSYDQSPVDLSGRLVGRLSPPHDGLSAEQLASLSPPAKTPG